MRVPAILVPALAGALALSGCSTPASSPTVAQRDPVQACALQLTGSVMMVRGFPSKTIVNEIVQHCEVIVPEIRRAEAQYARTASSQRAPAHS